MLTRVGQVVVSPIEGSTSTDYVVHNAVLHCSLPGEGVLPSRSPGCECPLDIRSLLTRAGRSAGCVLTLSQNAAGLTQLNYTRRDCLDKFWWRGEDSNLRRLSRQIYSLLPLATREPLQERKPLSIQLYSPHVNRSVACKHGLSAL